MGELACGVGAGIGVDENRPPGVHGHRELQVEVAPRAPRGPSVDALRKGGRPIIRRPRGQQPERPRRACSGCGRVPRACRNGTREPRDVDSSICIGRPAIPATLRHEPQRDHELHLGRRGPDPRHLQARQVSGRDPAAHGAAPARLRSGSHEAEGVGRPREVPGQDRGPPGPASASLRFRVLQHVALRLREAARRRPPHRTEPAPLHRRVQRQHARGAREVRTSTTRSRSSTKQVSYSKSCSASAIRR